MEERNFGLLEDLRLLGAGQLALVLRGELRGRTGPRYREAFAHRPVAEFQARVRPCVLRGWCESLCELGFRPVPPGVRLSLQPDGRPGSLPLVPGVAPGPGPRNLRAAIERMGVLLRASGPLAFGHLRKQLLSAGGTA